MGLPTQGGGQRLLDRPLLWKQTEEEGMEVRMLPTRTLRKAIHKCTLLGGWLEDHPPGILLW